MPGEKGKDAYDDIVDTPYPFQLNRPRMPRGNRAAQFSPFAALSGYEAAISETARVTDRRIDLDESAKELLSAKLQIIDDHLGEAPVVTITFFVPDKRKEGGEILTLSEAVKKLDAFERTLVTATGRIIPIENIYDLEGELFAAWSLGDGQG